METDLTVRVAIAKALQMESEKKDKKHAPMMAQICALQGVELRKSNRS